jgi:hypothetical protein
MQEKRFDPEFLSESFWRHIGEYKLLKWILDYFENSMTVMLIKTLIYILYIEWSR